MNWKKQTRQTLMADVVGEKYQQRRLMVVALFIVFLVNTNSGKKGNQELMGEIHSVFTSVIFIR